MIINTFEKFNIDLITGEAGEDVVRKLLEDNQYSFISNNKDYRYDIIMERNGRQKKFEIKTDTFCKPNDDSGNLFVENECRGKESGIMVTEADWFVTYYQYLNEIWFIPPKKLINICCYNLGIRDIASGGDFGSNTKGKLVPRERFRNQFIVVNL